MKSLPEEASVIKASERDNFDTYVVEAGRILCFEWRIGHGQTMDFSMVHTKSQAQDLSLRVYFSDQPMGDQFYPAIDSLDVFAIPRYARTISIGAPDTNQLYRMPANHTNYVMVQNMQNSENFFELVFSLKA